MRQRRRPLRWPTLIVTVTAVALALPAASAAAAPAPPAAPAATTTTAAASAAPTKETPPAPVVNTTRDTCTGSGNCLRVTFPSGPAAGTGATARTTKQAADVVIPGLPACGFSLGSSVLSGGRWAPNRTTGCVQSAAELALISLSTGKTLGTERVVFNEWFSSSATSLQISHGIGVEVVSGTGAFTEGGMSMTALYPCPVAVPADHGCSTPSPGAALNWTLLKGKTNATSWYETIKVGSGHELSRVGMGNTLSLTFAAPGAANTAPVTLAANASDLRCDDTTLIGGQGCVAPTFVPTVTFDSAANPKVLPAAHHMKLAQDVLPDHPGRKSDGVALQRIATGTEADANRDRSCDKNADYVPDGADSTCDEYPFATTKQTSSSAFSAMPVPSAANSSQGGLLAAGLKSNRVFVNDKYWVDPVVTDAKSGSVTSYPSLTSQFNAYSDAASCSSWSGGDATNSVQLPNGQRAWFFSDSYLGAPSARRNPFGYSFVNNSIVVQNGSSMRTVTGGNTCQEGNTAKDFWDRYAKATAPATGGFWWTGDQQLIGSNVVKFYYHGVPTSTAWENDYAGVASIPASSLANSTLTVNPTPIKCAAGGPRALWGTMTMKWTDGNWYIYGADGSTDAAHRLYLARASSANLANPAAWSYWTGSNAKAGTATWSSSCAAAAALPIGAGQPGGSVSNINGTAWLVQFDYDKSTLFGPGTINAHPASTPWGFSSRKVTLYRPSTTGVHQAPYYYLQYEARVQDGLRSGSDLVLSYNVNTSAVNTGCNGANNWDASIYRPRFLTASPTWFNTYDAAFVTIPGQTAKAAARTAAPTAAAATVVPGKRLHTYPTPPPAGAVLSGASSGAPSGAPSGAKATVTARAAAAASSIADAPDWFDSYTILGGCPPVSAAKNLTAPALPDGSVNMSWQTTGSDVWTYLYQCDTSTTTCTTGSSCSSDDYGGFSKQLGDLWLTVRAINYRPVVETAKNGHTFAWYICSSGMRSGYGGPSNHVSTKVTVPVPSAPAGLTGTRTTATSVTLKWTEVTYPTTANYLVPYYWDITAGQTAANATFGTAGLGGTSLTVTGLVSGHKYGFYLVARNLAGDSAKSNQVTNL